MNTFGIKFDHDCLIFQNFLLNLKLEDNTTNEDCIKRLESTDISEIMRNHTDIDVKRKMVAYLIANSKIPWHQSFEKPKCFDHLVCDELSLSANIMLRLVDSIGLWESLFELIENSPTKIAGNLFFTILHYGKEYLESRVGKFIDTICITTISNGKRADNDKESLHSYAGCCKIVVNLNNCVKVLLQLLKSINFIGNYITACKNAKWDKPIYDSSGNALNPRYLKMNNSAVQHELYLLLYTIIRIIDQTILKKYETLLCLNEIDEDTNIKSEWLIGYLVHTISHVITRKTTLNKYAISDEELISLLSKQPLCEVLKSLDLPKIGNYRKFWFKALITNEDFYLRTDIEQILIDNIALFDISILNLILTKIEIICSPELNTLILKLLAKLPFDDRLVVLRQFFDNRSLNSNILQCDNDIESKLRILFGQKSFHKIDSSSDFLEELTVLMIQNGHVCLQFIFRLIQMNQIRSSYSHKIFDDCILQVIKTKDALAEIVVFFKNVDGKSISNGLVDVFRKILFSIKESFCSCFLSLINDEFLHLNDYSKIQIIVQILINYCDDNQITDSDDSRNIYDTICKIIEKCRWDLQLYSEERYSIVSSLIEKFFNGGVVFQTNKPLTVVDVDTYHPLTKYYVIKAAGIPNQVSMFEVISPTFSVSDNDQELITALIYILSKSTISEWFDIYNYLKEKFNYNCYKVVDLFCKSLAITLDLSKSSLDETKCGLLFCLSQLIKFLKKLKINRIEKAFIDSVMFVSCHIPKELQESIGFTLLTSFGPAFLTVMMKHNKFNSLSIQLQNLISKINIDDMKIDQENQSDESVEKFLSEYKFDDYDANQIKC